MVSAGAVSVGSMPPDRRVGHRDNVESGRPAETGTCQQRRLWQCLEFGERRGLVESRRIGVDLRRERGVDPAVALEGPQDRGVLREVDVGIEQDVGERDPRAVVERLVGDPRCAIGGEGAERGWEIDVVDLEELAAAVREVGGGAVGLVGGRRGRDDQAQQRRGSRRRCRVPGDACRHRSGTGGLARSSLKPCTWPGSVLEALAARAAPQRGSNGDDGRIPRLARADSAERPASCRDTAPRKPDSTRRCAPTTSRRGPMRQGESGFACAWLGAALASTTLPFGVVTAPGQRYHPAITAQAIATLGEMFPGRFWAALGSGEAMNEHITGDGWPREGGAGRPAARMRRRDPRAARRRGGHAHRARHGRPGAPLDAAVASTCPAGRRGRARAPPAGSPSGRTGSSPSRRRRMPWRGRRRVPFGGRPRARSRSRCT